MKEVWKKQYEEKKPPWNYDDFDKDFERFLKKKFYIQKQQQDKKVEKY